jgi:hypothetical protein
VGLERGPLSLVSTIEELLEKKNSVSGVESREYGRRDPSRWPCGTLYPQMLALTSPTSGVRSVGIVRSRTQATEFVRTLRNKHRLCWQKACSSELKQVERIETYRIRRLKSLFLTWSLSELNLWRYTDMSRACKFGAFPPEDSTEQWRGVTMRPTSRRSIHCEVCLDSRSRTHYTKPQSSY